MLKKGAQKNLFKSAAYIFIRERKGGAINYQNLYFKSLWHKEKLYIQSVLRERDMQQRNLSLGKDIFSAEQVCLKIQRVLYIGWIALLNSNKKMPGF